MYRIMIIEDENRLAEELGIMLKSYGYECSIVSDFGDVASQVISYDPDLVLLDVNLPVADGYSVLKKIREQSEMPVILVTSRDTDMDELVGMNYGADDFIVKPYNNNILLARINRLLKRTYERNADSLLRHNGLVLNISSSLASGAKGQIELSKNESRILEYLINNRNRIVSRTEIIECLWDSDQFIDDNTLTVNMTRLRKKISQIGIDDFIKTKRGQGYIV